MIILKQENEAGGINATSNENAARRWNTRAVGGQRSNVKPGSPDYFEQIKKYRYGYETPFIPRLLCHCEPEQKVLEIGVGNGIDAVEFASRGAEYFGIDITENHVLLAKANLSINGYGKYQIFHSDLLATDTGSDFDIVYSFGTLHHIAHEKEYLQNIYSILKPHGELRVALYSKYSFFNLYMFITWIIKNRCQVSFNKWQGYVSDRADFDHPITIKIRSKKEIVRLYEETGFTLKKYYKRGFVQRYVPIFGELFLKPDGYVLNFLGTIFGWYHILILKKQ